MAKIDRIRLKVYAYKSLNETPIVLDESIELQIITSENINKKHSLICSKLYYFTDDYLDELEWWIELNKMIGYDKIVIYNSTIGTGDKFDKILAKYPGFVDVYQMHCLPDFGYMNENESLFFEYKEVYISKKNYRVYFEMHYEQLSFNECFQKYKDQYKYIAIYDHDDVIMPRYSFENYESFSNHNSNFIQSYPKTLDKYSQKFTKLIPYFDTLRKNVKFNDNFTMHFKMGHYLKPSTVNIIFDALKNNFDKIKINQSMSSIRVEEKTLNSHVPIDFNFFIYGEKDIKHVKNLLNFYEKNLQPFLIRNNVVFNKISEFNYARYFMLIGKSSSQHIWGKSIYDSRISEHIWQHYPDSFRNTEIPMDYGHVSHFRRNYKFEWKNISISDFHFDFNYFYNYLIPILKKKGFKLKF